MLYNLRMKIKNSNPNIGYKNVDITIKKKNHLHNKFHNHVNTINIWITIGQKLYKINKTGYHPLIDFPKKKNSH